jgi:nicotinamide-nucleotide amidase
MSDSGAVASVDDLVSQAHAGLRASGRTVATAESLTGGLIAAALTSAPGSSVTFRGGLVVYATDLKATLAGVATDLLAQRGAVDPEVAAGLAEGVRDRLGASFGIGITGVAGPSPQDGKAVGTVFLALAGPGATVVRELRLGGDRAAIRAASVHAALSLLVRESSPREPR